MRFVTLLLLLVIHCGAFLNAVDTEFPVEIATAGRHDFDIGISVDDHFLDLLSIAVDGTVIETRRGTSKHSLVDSDGTDLGPLNYRFEKILLTEGSHVVTVHTENVAHNPTVELPATVNKFAFAPSPTAPTPFGGIIHRIPGTFQAEDYDIGGAGLAYDRSSWQPIFQSYRQDDIGIHSNSEITSEVLRFVHLDTALQNPHLYDQWVALPQLFAPAWIEYTVDCGVEGNLDVSISGQVRDFSRSTAIQRIQLSVDGVTMPELVTFHHTSWTELTGGVFRNVPFTLGTHRLRFTVLTPPAGSSGSDIGFTPSGVSFEAIGVWGPPTPPPPPVEVVMENSDPGVTLQGQWHPATIAPGYHGPDYLYAIGMPHRDERAYFRPTLPLTASYEVSVWYPERNVRSAAVPITISTYDRTEQRVIDQRSHGGQWVVLGTWTLLAGQSTTVTIETGRQSGITVADAVRFLQVGDAFVYPADVGDVVIDDADQQRVHFVGNWPSSHAVQGFVGSGYRYAGRGSAAPTTATYTPYLPMTGYYEVSVQSPAYGGRSPATPVTVRHRDGSSTVVIDQRSSGVHVLGRWMFAAGNQGDVTIDGSASRGYVIADSVRFRLISAPKNGQPLVVPGTYDGVDHDVISSDVEVSRRNVRWAKAQADCVYTISVADAGTYDIAASYFRDPDAPGSQTINEAAISVDGVRVMERFFVADSGVLRTEKMYLDAGLHSLTLFCRESEGSFPAAVPTIYTSLSVSLSPTQQAPFSGSPIPIPGVIQGEDYDRGGVGLAYNRVSWAGGFRYRPDDIGVMPGFSPNLPILLHLDTAAVNPIAATEFPDPILGIPPQSFAAAWAEYTIDSASAGIFDAVLHVRVPDPTWNTAVQRVQLAIDGVTVSDPLTIPWSGYDFVEATLHQIAIPAGTHRLRITLLPPPDGSYADGTGSFPWGIDIDQIEFTEPAPIVPLTKG